MIVVYEPDRFSSCGEVVTESRNRRGNVTWLQLRAGCRYCAPWFARTCRLGRVLLAAVVLFAVGGRSVAQTETVSIPDGPGQGKPAQGQFAGSVPSQPVPGVVPISLQDAIDRGLKQNLGALLSSA